MHPMFKDYIYTNSFPLYFIVIVHFVVMLNCCTTLNFSLGFGHVVTGKEEIKGNVSKMSPAVDP